LRHLQDDDVILQLVSNIIILIPFLKKRLSRFLKKNAVGLVAAGGNANHFSSVRIAV